MISIPATWRMVRGRGLVDGGRGLVVGGLVDGELVEGGHVEGGRASSTCLVDVPPTNNPNDVPPTDNPNTRHSQP